MDFSIPEMHTEIRKLASDILSDHAEPERLKKLEANGAYFDKEVWSKFLETSLHASSLPEDLGGMGMDFFATTMVAEALGQNLNAIPYISTIVSTALPLLNYQSNGNVKELLQSITNGSELATTALIEPGNEDTLNPSTIASLSGNNATVSGTKHCVPYAQESTYCLLSAKADNDLVAVLVDLSSKGVSLTAQQCTSNELQYAIALDNADAVVIATGTEAEALFNASIAMTTVAYCSMAIGVAEKMVKLASTYTSERKQFGVPIATFQAVAHKLANCYIDTECLKIITLKAASDVNQGNYQSDTVSMAKVWCGDALHRISQETQHVHGGFGIDKDYQLFRYCLWSKQLELALGNSRQHLSKLADSLEQQYLQA
jgi:alkylation response protein AidB-like acyl-CoA dehydrogenase